MKDLTVFNREVIPVYTTDTGEKIVLGRELHERLNIETPYTQWFDRMCGYGFTENADFSSFSQKSEKPSGGRPSQEHYLKFDMAKHIAMIQRSEIGFKIRDKLIALETNVSDLSPQLQLLINMEVRQKQMEAKQEVLDAKIDGIRDVVALNPHDWRKDSAKIITQIAASMGGNEHISNVRNEIYTALEVRFGVSLKIRLTNKRRRMADEGICKSKRDKQNQLDVIADDKKLIEGYIAIVKEMAIKSGVRLPDEMSA